MSVLEQLNDCLAAIRAAEVEIRIEHGPSVTKHGDLIKPHERPEQVRDSNGRYLLADYAIAKAQILIALASLPQEHTNPDKFFGPARGHFPPEQPPGGYVLGTLCGAPPGGCNSPPEVCDHGRFPDVCDHVHMDHPWGKGFGIREVHEEERP